MTTKTKSVQTEISAACLREFMLSLLIEHEGVIEQRELEKEVEKAFGYSFSKADLRIIKGQRRPKWKNQLDCAKATATSAKLIAVRSFTRKKRKQTWIVLLDKSTTHPAFYEWGLGKNVKRGYQRKCPKCRDRRPLGEKKCRSCGHTFPLKNQREHRIPK